jgi:putative ABC transport system substrate-binding protein
LPSVKEAAQALALSLAEVPVVDAVGMTTAVENFAMEPNEGFLIGPGVVPARSDEMVRLIAQSRLPAIYGSRDFVARGGLISYDADLDEIPRGVAGYVDRLLRGAKVSDLPVQYPTKFRLVVNLKAAKAIGLTIPESFLGRADEVIE